MRSHVFGRVLVGLVSKGLTFAKRPPTGLPAVAAVWVDPAQVQRRLRGDARIKHWGSPSASPVSLIGGDWDFGATEMPINQNLEACYERFMEGRPWDTISKYQQLLEHIKKGGTVDGCKTETEFEQRYSRIDRMHETIRNEGTLRTKGVEALKVCIARDGEIIHCGGGGHRLAISKVLKLQHIPVIVSVIHPEAITELQKSRSQRRGG